MALYVFVVKVVSAIIFGSKEFLLKPLADLLQTDVSDMLRTCPAQIGKKKVKHKEM